MARPAAAVGRPKVDEQAVDYRRRLEALRDDLTRRLADEESRCAACERVGPSHRDAAALASRLESVLAALASLPAAAREEDTADELNRRRAARKARAAAAPRP